MSIFPSGPSESDPPPPDFDVADPPGDDTGLPDGETPDEPSAAYSASSSVFRGPALSFTLPEPPDPGTVTVTHQDRGEVDVQVDGDTVSRPTGHFGKGRWTVRYLPA